MGERGPTLAHQIALFEKTNRSYCQTKFDGTKLEPKFMLLLRFIPSCYYQSQFKLLPKKTTKHYYLLFFKVKYYQKSFKISTIYTTFWVKLLPKKSVKIYYKLILHSKLIPKKFTKIDYINFFLSYYHKSLQKFSICCSLKVTTNKVRKNLL